MHIKDFENTILNEIEKIVNKVISDNLFLNISAKARAGAEISHVLENKFVEYTANHAYFSDSEQAAKEQTKNPWDVRTFFKLKSHIEEIWIDFKAFKITSKDSNPDIGTPTKVVEFIRKGGFYLVYVYVFYQEKENGLEFVRNDDRYAKIYFLKDISKTVRRNPKNQLQVNISEPPEYRTREQFIDLLMGKIKESHERQMIISERKLKIIESEKDDIIRKNRISEENIVKNI